MLERGKFYGWRGFWLGVPVAVTVAVAVAVTVAVAVSSGQFVALMIFPPNYNFSTFSTFSTCLGHNLIMNDRVIFLRNSEPRTQNPELRTPNPEPKHVVIDAGDQLHVRTQTFPYL